MNRNTNFATNTVIQFKKLYNFRKQQKIYMTFGLVMSSNTQQKNNRELTVAQLFNAPYCKIQA